MLRIPAVSLSVCVLACTQASFAEDDAIQLLQGKMVRAESQIRADEAPVFQNLKTVVLVCGSSIVERAPFPMPLQLSLKKRLEHAGLKVLGENKKGTKYPNLNLVLSISPGHPGEIEVSAELLEWTLLRRNGKSIILPSWQRKEQFVPANEEEQARQVATIANKIVDEFAAEYAAANNAPNDRK